MPTLDKMLEIGLYINDLSMHDSSREMVLAGTQQAAEFKIALEQVSVLKQAIIPQKMAGKNALSKMHCHS